MNSNEISNKLHEMHKLHETAQNENYYLTKRDSPYRRTRLRSTLLDIRRICDELRDALKN